MPNKRIKYAPSVARLAKAFGFCSRANALRKQAQVTLWQIQNGLMDIPARVLMSSLRSCPSIGSTRSCSHLSRPYWKKLGSVALSELNEAERTVLATDGSLIEVLRDRCDQQYCNSAEPIADRLFAYIRASRYEIQLGE
jgi:hypothetical protein